MTIVLVLAAMKKIVNFGICLMDTYAACDYEMRCLGHYFAETELQAIYIQSAPNGCVSNKSKIFWELTSPP